MGLTLSKTREGVIGDKAYWMGSVTFDAAYATGGESFTPADCGLDDFEHVNLTPDTLTSTTTLLPTFDDSADKIQLFECGADGLPFDEIGTDNVSALVIYVFAIGNVRNR